MEQTDFHHSNLLRGLVEPVRKNSKGNVTDWIESFEDYGFFNLKGENCNISFSPIRGGIYGSPNEKHEYVIIRSQNRKAELEPFGCVPIEYARMIYTRLKESGFVDEK